MREVNIVGKLILEIDLAVFLMALKWGGEIKFKEIKYGEYHAVSHT